MSSQSFLSGQAGLKGRIFFQFSFAFSGHHIFRSYCFAKRNSKLGAMGKESDGKRLQLWPFNSPSLGPPLSITHRGRCVS